ncbi:hypothetical protein Ddye_017206 [Dipteronia dyeriana]|uniref:3'-5' exonuclease domain-containing protein n=1 Tax=Dipteronia dyeriana TaxID=168575 RepID=A0AAD9U899_9ROSI|nr:hypothetical protein Ddye_017206 [Dipteronia dyeriana]
MVSYCGKIIETTVTSNASVAENWVHGIRSMNKHKQESLVVGLNCKWSLHPIRSLSGKIVTLQLCIDTKCLILLPTYMENIPDSIKNFFDDPNVVFVGIDVEETLQKLKTEYGLELGKKIDIRVLVKLHFPISFHGKPGLKALACQLVDLRMWKPKHDCWNNWGSRVLGMEQIKYACVDAYVTYRIGQKLLIETR